MGIANAAAHRPFGDVDRCVGRDDGNIICASPPTTSPPHQQASNQRTDGTPAQDEPPKSFGERLSRIWDRAFDDPVAFYTFILGIFTGLLAVIASVQIAFLIRADNTARITAIAAKESSKATKASVAAFNASERAYVVAQIVEIKVDETNSREPSVILRFSLRNVGKTAAIMDQVTFWLNYTAQPDQQKLFYSPDPPFFGVIVNRGGETSPTKFSRKFKLSKEEGDAIIRDQLHLWLSIDVAFFEVIAGTSQSVKFLFRYDRQKKIFRMQQTSGYNPRPQH